MRTFSAFLALALSAAVVTAAGAADDKKPTDTRKTERDVQKSDRKEIKPHPGGLVEANWLIGTKVHDAQGKVLGDIEELWVDPKTGQMKDVVLSIGTTMGVGGKNKVVAWKDLNLAWKDQKLFVSVDPAASPATSSKKR